MWRRLSLHHTYAYQRGTIYHSLVHLSVPAQETCQWLIHTQNVGAVTLLLFFFKSEIKVAFTKEFVVNTES